MEESEVKMVVLIEHKDDREERMEGERKALEH